MISVKDTMFKMYPNNFYVGYILMVLIYNYLYAANQAHFIFFLAKMLI